MDRAGSDADDLDPFVLDPEQEARNKEEEGLHSSVEGAWDAAEATPARVGEHIGSSVLSDVPSVAPSEEPNTTGTDRKNMAASAPMPSAEDDNSETPRWAYPSQSELHETVGNGGAGIQSTIMNETFMQLLNVLAYRQPQDDPIEETDAENASSSSSSDDDLPHSTHSAASPQSRDPSVHSGQSQRRHTLHRRSTLDALSLSTPLEALRAHSTRSSAADASSASDAESVDTRTRARRRELASKVAQVFDLTQLEDESGTGSGSTEEDVLAEYAASLFFKSVFLQGYIYLTTGHICFYAFLPKAKEGETLRSGSLSIRSMRRYSKHFFILKDEVLSWYPDQTEPYFPDGYVDLHYCSGVEMSPKHDTHFKLFTADKTYHLNAQSAADAKEWVKVLKKTLFVCHHRGSSLKLVLPLETVVDVESTSLSSLVRAATTTEFTSNILHLRVYDADVDYAVNDFWFSHIAHLDRTINEISSALTAFRMRYPSAISLVANWHLLLNTIEGRHMYTTYAPASTSTSPEEDRGHPSRVTSTLGAPLKWISHAVARDMPASQRAGTDSAGSSKRDSLVGSVKREVPIQGGSKKDSLASTGKTEPKAEGSKRNSFRLSATFDPLKFDLGGARGDGEGKGVTRDEGEGKVQQDVTGPAAGSSDAPTAPAQPVFETHSPSPYDVSSSMATITDKNRQSSATPTPVQTPALSLALSQALGPTPQTAAVTSASQPATTTTAPQPIPQAAAPSQHTYPPAMSSSPSSLATLKAVPLAVGRRALLVSSPAQWYSMMPSSLAALSGWLRASALKRGPSTPRETAAGRRPLASLDIPQPPRRVLEILTEHSAERAYGTDTDESGEFIEQGDFATPEELEMDGVGDDDPGVISGDPSESKFEGLERGSVHGLSPHKAESEPSGVGRGSDHPTDLAGPEPDDIEDDYVIDSPTSLHNEPTSTLDHAKFRRDFGLPGKEELLEKFSLYLFRSLPVYGKMYISSSYFCFRSINLLSRTTMILPIADVLNVSKHRSYRFGYAGLIVLIKGHEELFFEFPTPDRRNAALRILEKHLERYSRHHRASFTQQSGAFAATRRVQQPAAHLVTVIPDNQSELMRSPVDEVEQDRLIERALGTEASAESRELHALAKESALSADRTTHSDPPRESSPAALVHGATARDTLSPPIGERSATTDSLDGDEETAPAPPIFTTTPTKRLPLSDSSATHSSASNSAVMFGSNTSDFVTFKPDKPLRFTCLTIGSRGDVQPYIALCKGLIAEGHECRIATHGEYRPWIEGHGIGFAEVGGDPAQLMELMIAHDFFTFSFMREALSRFRGWLEDLLHSAWEACREGTDVLIESPSAIAGIHIAHALQIPYFRAFTMPWSRTRVYPHAFAVPDHQMGGSYNYMSYIMFEQVFWRAMSGQVNRWRRRVLGLPATSLEQLQENKVPFLYNFSPVVIPPPLDWPEYIHVTGYWHLDNPDDSHATRWEPAPALLAFLARARSTGTKVVFVGFGSIIIPDTLALTRTIVEAAAAAGVCAIVAKGWADRRAGKPGAAARAREEAELFEQPHVFRVESIPHDWLFPRIDAAVHHGGAGTTGASLRAGLPTIIRPFFGDQYFYADRVSALGVGAALRTLTTATLAAAISSAVGDSRVVQRAQQLGAAIRAEDGVGNAIECIYRELDYARSLTHGREVDASLRSKIGTRLSQGRSASRDRADALVNKLKLGSIAAVPGAALTRSLSPMRGGLPFLRRGLVGAGSSGDAATGRSRSRPSDSRSTSLSASHSGGGSSEYAFDEWDVVSNSQGNSQGNSQSNSQLAE